MGAMVVCCQCRTAEKAVAGRSLECGRCGCRLIVSVVGDEPDEYEDILQQSVLRRHHSHRLPGVPLMARPEVRLQAHRRKVRRRRKGDWLTATSSLAAGAGTALLLVLIGT